MFYFFQIQMVMIYSRLLIYIKFIFIDEVSEGGGVVASFWQVVQEGAGNL